MNQSNEELYNLGSKKLIEEKYCYTYVPENISGDVDAIVYYPGSGGYKNDDVAIREYIANNPNKIVIINKNHDGRISGDNAPFGDDIINDFNSIQENNNVNITNIDVLGHSSGESYAFRAAEVFNDNGYHTGNVVIVGSATNTAGFNISDNMADNFVNNNTNVLIFNEYERSKAVANNLNALTSKGINVGFVYGEGYSEYSDRHCTLKKETIRNGLFLFLDGQTDKLGDNRTLNYHFSVYDSENNRWLDNISEEEFAALYPRATRTGAFITTIPYKLLDDNYGYLKTLDKFNYNTKGFGFTEPISSNSRYVLDKLNIIRSNVSNNGFIGALDSNLGNITSANPVLALENSIISQYFSITGGLLEKVAKETASVASIAFAFDKMDENLSKYASELAAGMTIQDIIEKHRNGNLYNLSPELANNLNYRYNMDLSKYNEKVENGFELHLSNRIYSLSDFDTEYAREHWGYTPEQAVEAFIATCINECDKTPDGMLATVSVALNRCESDNWSKYYTRNNENGNTNGTLPFDQMFVNDGAQYSVISGGSYRKYLPSEVSIEQINEHLAKYGTSYEELAAVAEDALYGGVRNNDYTGFRASLEKYENYGEELNPYGGRFAYENPNVDAPAAKTAQEARVEISLDGTAYTGKNSIKVTPMGDTNTINQSSDSNNEIYTPSSTYTQNNTQADGSTSTSLNTGSSSTSSSSTSSSSTSSYSGSSSNSSGSTSSYSSSSSTSSGSTSSYSGSSSTSSSHTSSYTSSSSTPSRHETTTPVSEPPKETTPVVTTTTSHSETNIQTSSTTTQPESNYQTTTNHNGNNQTTTSNNTNYHTGSNNTSTTNNTPSYNDNNTNVEEPITPEIDTNPPIETTPPVDNTPTTENNPTIDTKPNSKPPAQKTNNNNTIKGIGAAVAGMTALGGITYLGAQKLKQIKNNNSIDDDDDRDKNKDGDR